jgi:mRNA interferase MazF
MEQVLKRKDIVLVPFPFTDQSASKRRPALVISNDKFNSESEDVIVCAITSNPDSGPYTVQIRKEDWKDGMYSESYVKSCIILTIAKRAVDKRIGRLSSERFGQVMEQIRGVVG